MGGGLLLCPALYSCGFGCRWCWFIRQQLQAGAYMVSCVCVCVCMCVGEAAVPISEDTAQLCMWTTPPARPQASQINIQLLHNEGILSQPPTNSCHPTLLRLSVGGGGGGDVLLSHSSPKYLKNTVQEPDTSLPLRDSRPRLAQCPAVVPPAKQVWRGRVC